MNAEIDTTFRDPAFLSRLDVIFMMWKVRRARDFAWSNAELLWHLEATPRLQRRFFSELDSFTGFAGRGLLVHHALGDPA